MVLPKRFDIVSLDWGVLRRSSAFRFFFKHKHEYKKQYIIIWIENTERNTNNKLRLYTAITNKADKTNPKTIKSLHVKKADTPKQKRTNAGTPELHFKARRSSCFAHKSTVSGSRIDSLKPIREKGQMAHKTRISARIVSCIQTYQCGLRMRRTVIV